ncbi:MAG: excinuclease subunit [Ignavibacteria bacterium]|nr:excinuclease subunit [Ignavibacteria bacterium]
MAKNGTYIKIQSANVHNLKNISVDIPRNAITVVTGVSGSGKSSLAFDTLYAEGQRRFAESLSAYARQFLERMDKPDVESISGLPPAIAIGQKPPSKNPRSTVGTSTEVYDYLRLLYGRIGKTYCKDCGKLVRKDSPGSVVTRILKFDEGDKLYILFPINATSKTLEPELMKYRESGFFRAIIGSSDEIINIEQDSFPKIPKNDIAYILVDRFVLRYDEDSVTRLTDSIETAFSGGSGKILIRNLTKEKELAFSSKYECNECEIVYVEPDPKLFSFNNPYGACPKCEGFGRTIGVDEDLIIPNKGKTLRNGAVHPFNMPGFAMFQRALLKIAPKHSISLDVPIDSLTPEQIDIIRNGSGDYTGIKGFITLLEENSHKIQYRILLSRYRGYTKCYACDGSRLRTSARQVIVDGKSIPELVSKPLDELLSFIKQINLTDYETKVAGQVVRELEWRIGLLVDIGLNYLTLDRLTHTLSGGEAQRINLSTALGSSLVGTLYVLDEPSIGMHPRDTNRLIDILFKLRNLGNTIVVVEHDHDIIRKADYILDLGPRAGEFGGNIVFSGNFNEMLSSGRSLTADYFTGRKKIEIPSKRSHGSGKKLVINKARKYNLKIDKVEIPLNCITVVTGVSGSGKSTLINEILYPGLTKYDAGYVEHPGFFEKIYGSENIGKIEIVDQSSIGKSSRSTPATYTKAFDSIRDLFSQTQAAKQLGWKPGHFSFNVPGGRCEVCEGEGIVSVDMQFLPDVQLICEACKGSRYKKEALAITYKGKSIIDVLNMTIDEATEFFGGINKITKKLSILKDVGLGYLRLGQPSTMLSGGESQRIKLANHLDSSVGENCLFIFDEPTTGLHSDDISKLLNCFRRLISAGHSVLIIEHNLNIIASADWIIDLGPDAGEAGGRLVAEGTPEQIVKVKESYTGAALSDFFKQN